jgi:hypothetical protein
MIIYKYPLTIADGHTVMMPEGARILSVAEQSGVLCIWALVDETIEANVKNTFLIVGTGNPLSLTFLNNGKTTFIGTVVMTYGLVWHVFHDIGE